MSQKPTKFQSHMMLFGWWALNLIFRNQIFRGEVDGTITYSQMIIGFTGLA